MKPPTHHAFRHNCILATLSIAIAGSSLLLSCGRNNDSTPKNSQATSPKPYPSTQSAPTNHQQAGDSITFEKPRTIEEFAQRLEAVRQIGKQKRIEAVPMLLNSLLQITPLTTDNALDFTETYPCSAALVEIGEPAVSQIQSRFLAASSNVEQLVLLDALLKIKGAAFVSEWIGGLPNSSSFSLPESRRKTLKQWVLSQAH